eukprot:TRINITY_DN933_c0_g2_i2.p2 TRINITY_DN933_c0_g2~~TRINITY_DN933_c0_g2_i2.p2  ORF type:complete len:214 (-),score=135.24 TRINITY_DN933_c0_g2_i2:99-740(-)
MPKKSKSKSGGEEKAVANPDDLVITPDELLFAYPKNPTAFVNLENKGEARISFKVKGTAVERYSVRPNRGVVHAKSKDKISLTLKRVPEGEFTDRFMVQWMPVPAAFLETEENVKDLWIKAKEENKKVYYKNFPCRLDEAAASESSEPASESSEEKPVAKAKKGKKDKAKKDEKKKKDKEGGEKKKKAKADDDKPKKKAKADGDKKKKSKSKK